MNRSKKALFGLITLCFLLLTQADGLFLPPLWAQEWANGRCAVTYKVTGQWGNQFAAQIELTNLAQPIDGWTLEWVFPGGQTITQLANGRHVQNEAVVSVANGQWNRILESGQNTILGFHALSGSAHPTEFFLNGQRCEAESLTVASPFHRGAARFLFNSLQ